MSKRKKQELSDAPVHQNQIRLRPAIIIVTLQWICWLIIPYFVSGAIAMMVGVFGGLLGGLAIFVWWLFFSRSPKPERWSAFVLMVVSLTIAKLITHESIATGLGNLMYFVYAIPTLSLAFVLWAVISSRLSILLRRISMVLTILLACGVWILVKSEGISGTASAIFSWRWAQTNEEKLLSQSDGESIDIQSDFTDSEAEWPGFRGAKRDGITHGTHIETDWTESSPVELWRQAIGPGCSSFAVHGDVFYTQEQRGEEEVVSCYELNSGKLVWMHSDSTRFWDSHAGAGPRSTPTLSGGRVYTFGATGILNVLDARDGTLIWSRNAAIDASMKDSGWGFTSSPLVVDDVVLAAATGKLMAYDSETSELRWAGPVGGDSYSSPHLISIDGVEQVLLLSGVGVTSFETSTGNVLWKYSWENDTRILQPAQLPNGDLLINAGNKKGLRRLAITKKEKEWSIEERWSSVGMRPDFNDFVVHKGHAYGIDGFTVACIDVKDGTRKWKGGRYGGQLILLADQDLLLVLSEKGEVALIEAVPEQFTELAQMPAIEGKTWNHPVLVNDILLVRNTQEMVAYQMPLAGG